MMINFTEILYDVITFEFKKSCCMFFVNNIATEFEVLNSLRFSVIYFSCLIFRLHRMHEMLIIVTDVCCVYMSISLSVCHECTAKWT